VTNTIRLLHPVNEIRWPRGLPGYLGSPEEVAATERMYPQAEARDRVGPEAVAYTRPLSSFNVSTFCEIGGV
jgi:hypothetical protein